MLAGSYPPCSALTLGCIASRRAEEKGFTMSIEVLTAEQLGQLSPAELLAYVAAIQASAQAAQGLVAAAKQKQTAEARQSLQDSIRASLSFPTLGADTLAAVKAAGASGFVVVYDLATGIGTPSATYPTAGVAKAKVAKPATGAVSTGPVIRAEPRELKAMYDAACPEGSAARIEDDADFDKRIARAIERRSYPKVDKTGAIILDAAGLPETDVPVATNKLRWALMNDRLAKIAKAEAQAKVAGA